MRQTTTGKELLSKFARKLVSEIRAGKIRSREELNKAKNRLAAETGMNRVPTNADISVLFHGKLGESEKKILLQKPVRSISGVSVVAAMIAPHECPGKCIYCPSGIDDAMPKSYTGKEPAAMRALLNDFNAYRQVAERLGQLEATGHDAGKIELVIMGGNFLSTPKKYQDIFVKGCLDAITGKKSRTLAEAKRSAEIGKRRLVGLTIETRPDYCKKKHVKRMLELGATRIELGVQMPSDEVYIKVNRGHTVKDVIDATRFLKDSSLKVCYHVMPGIYGLSLEKQQQLQQQMNLLKGLFEKEEFMPDMLKIYPALVIRGTKLHDLWKKGEYFPLESNEAAEFIAEFKRSVPRWVRIMRVQRDIPANLISAGVVKSNLRELVEEKMKEKGTECKCIRHREIGLRELKDKARKKRTRIAVTEYTASCGKEFFIESIDDNDSLYGFARLRIPGKTFIKGLDEKTGLLRELHVYGTALKIGGKAGKGAQHRGIGKKLMGKAEEISAKEGMKKIAVIAALGTREYYRKFFGYRRKEHYMVKKI